MDLRSTHSEMALVSDSFSKLMEAEWEPLFQGDERHTQSEIGRMQLSKVANNLGKSSTNNTRLVMFGKTGSGKSATCNTLIGHACFPSKVSMKGVTTKCSYRKTNIFHRDVIIVDTPGIFNATGSREEEQKELEKVIEYTSPGPHAFVLVISLADRFTEEDTKVMDRLEQFFGPEAVKFAIVLFTRMDLLEESCQQTIKDVKPLQRVLDACGKRFVEFDNTGLVKKRENCLFDLFQTIDKMKGDGVYKTEKYFTNDLYINYRLKISKLLEDSQQQIRDLQSRLEKQKKKNIKDLEKMKHLETQNEDLRQKLEGADDLGKSSDEASASPQLDRKETTRTCEMM